MIYSCANCLLEKAKAEGAAPEGVKAPELTKGEATAREDFHDALRALVPDLAARNAAIDRILAPKAPPELKGAREADIWRGRVVDYTNILASRFAGEISTEAAIQRLDAMAIADCKRIARPDLPLEVLPPESPTPCEPSTLLALETSLSNAEKCFHHGNREADTECREPELALWNIGAAGTLLQALKKEMHAGAKPGAESETAKPTTMDPQNAWREYRATIRGGYGLGEMEAFKAGFLAAKPGSGATPVSLVSPAPVLRPLEEFIPELLELARGEDHDQEGCPQDDTCRCANIAKLEAELKAIQRMRAGAPAPQPIPPGARELAELVLRRDDWPEFDVGDLDVLRVFPREDWIAILKAAKHIMAQPIPPPLTYTRVEVREGYPEAGKRGVVFSQPQAGEAMATVLMDGEAAPDLWAWRVLKILGPDTRKPAQPIPPEAGKP